MSTRKLTATIASLLVTLFAGANPGFAAANEPTIQPFQCGSGVGLNIVNGPTGKGVKQNRGFAHSNTQVGISIDTRKGGKAGVTVELVGLGGDYVSDFQRFELLVAKLNKEAGIGLGNDLGFLFCLEYGNEQYGSVYLKANELKRGLLGEFYTKLTLTKEQLRSHLIEQGQVGLENTPISIQRVVIVYKPGNRRDGKSFVKRLNIGLIELVTRTGSGLGGDYLQSLFPSIVLTPVTDCDADTACNEVE